MEVKVGEVQVGEVQVGEVQVRVEVQVVGGGSN